MKTLWLLTGCGRLEETNHRGFFFFQEDVILYGRLAWITYCMQFLSCIMCSSVLFLKVLSYTPSKHSTYSGHIDQTMRRVIACKSLKTKRKLLNRLAREVIVVASRRRSFITKCSNCKALNGNALVFWIRFMRSGRPREVVAHEGLVVIAKKNNQTVTLYVCLLILKQFSISK